MVTVPEVQRHGRSNSERSLRAQVHSYLTGEMVVDDQSGELRHNFNLRSNNLSETIEMIEKKMVKSSKVRERIETLREKEAHDRARRRMLQRSARAAEQAAREQEAASAQRLLLREKESKHKRGGSVIMEVVSMSQKMTEQKKRNLRKSKIRAMNMNTSYRSRVRRGHSASAKITPSSSKKMKAVPPLASSLPSHKNHAGDLVTQALPLRGGVKKKKKKKKKKKHVSQPDTDRLFFARQRLFKMQGIDTMQNRSPRFIAKRIVQSARKGNYTDP